MTQDPKSKDIKTAEDVTFFFIYKNDTDRYTINSNTYVDREY